MGEQAAEAMMPMPKGPCRLITRADFDGLACAALFRELNIIDDVLFAEPKDTVEGQLAVRPTDISANLPYREGVQMCFDNHVSESLRLGDEAAVIIDPKAPSAARVVYEYFGGKKRFKKVKEEMILAVDRCDSGDLSREEVLSPSGWVLLNFLLDPRTGLQEITKFKIPTAQFMMGLIDFCLSHGIDEIIALPAVRERSGYYFAHEELYRKQILKYATMVGHVVVVDLRMEDVRLPGNRFSIYALFPEALVSIFLHHPPLRDSTIISVGKSVFNRSARVNIGALLMNWGGGGHSYAGTCRVAPNDADAVVEDLLQAINAAG